MNNYSHRIGIPTMLMLLLSLCLLTFSILSFETSYSDYKLSNKMLNKYFSYYSACNAASEKLASIDSSLHKLYNESVSKEDFYKLVSDYPATYLLDINDSQWLEITLEYHYPDSNSSSLYSIKSWLVVNQTDEYDNHLNVIP